MFVFFYGFFFLWKHMPLTQFSFFIFFPVSNIAISWVNPVPYLTKNRKILQLFFITFFFWIPKKLFTTVKIFKIILQGKKIWSITIFKCIYGKKNTKVFVCYFSMIFDKAGIGSVSLKRNESGSLPLIERKNKSFISLGVWS